jgi:hypothetical protein
LRGALFNFWKIDPRNKFDFFDDNGSKIDENLFKTVSRALEYSHQDDYKELEFDPSALRYNIVYIGDYKQFSDTFYEYNQ